MEEVKRIYNLLSRGKALKIREIAKELELDAFHVSEIMFSSENSSFWHQDEALWYAVEGALVIEEPVIEDPLLAKSISAQRWNTERFFEVEDSETLRIYIDEVTKYRLYTDRELLELFERYWNGDEFACQLIVKSHLRLVVGMASFYSGKGAKMEDLIQEGNIGLLKAVKKFDPTINHRFAEYAKSWIFQAITQGITSLPYLIRIPINQINIHTKLQQKINEFEQREYYIPSECELNLLSATNGASYLLNGFPSDLSDMIINDNDMDENYISEEPESDHFLLLESTHQEILQMLSTLNRRQKDIVQLFYGIDCESISMYMIAEQFGLTRERVRQILFRSIRNLREINGVLVSDSETEITLETEEVFEDDVDNDDE